MSTGVHSEHAILRVPTGICHIDPAHSSVESQIKHMMIATVKGRFTDFEGTVVAAPDIADSSVRRVVRTASVDTNEPTRDAYLRSADFFDADHYPEITFESSGIAPVGGPRFQVVGALTIKGTTGEIALESAVEGSERDPWGNDRIGLNARSAIDRKDFGLTWQTLLESGGSCSATRLRSRSRCRRSGSAVTTVFERTRRTGRAVTDYPTSAVERGITAPDFNLNSTPDQSVVRVTSGGTPTFFINGVRHNDASTCSRCSTRPER
jgi:polyisoprenoid-binding protein YceI